MAYYHYQCQYCLCTTYLYDDGKDDGIIRVGAFDDCGCHSEDNSPDNENENFYDDDDD